MIEDEIIQTKEGWWVLKDDTHISRWVEESGRLDHDQTVLQMLKPYIRSGSIVYDLGAAIGDHTIFYLEAVGPRGIVIAIEPHPIQFECLIRNCPEALSFRVAVGQYQSPEVYLFNQPGSVASSRLVQPMISKFLEEFDSAESKEHSLSSSCEQIVIDDACVLPGDVSFMKFDIEGCEPGALRGAHRTILKHRPVIWMEVNPRGIERQGYGSGELKKILEEELKYKVKFYPKDGGDWDGFEGKGHCDALCLPYERFYEVECEENQLCVATS
jgi:FkbM family methyltransferase